MEQYQAGGQEDGLVLRSHWEPDGEVWLEILHAEPMARFSGALLRRCRRGEARPFTEVDRVGIGGVVRIRGKDRMLVYRLVSHDPQWDVYTGEWPD